MKVLCCEQVPKDLIYSEAIEDAVEIAYIERILAISDGASESFDSRTWAQLLVKNFARSPSLTPEWLSEVIRQYSMSYNQSTLSWSKLAAFERGSFATLLGLKVHSSQYSVDLISVGDSLAVLLSNETLVDSFPYKDAQQFQLRPELFSTHQLHNNFFEDAGFYSRHCTTWSFKALEHPVILCMTDALGEWALKMEQDGEPQWNTLLSIKNQSQLQSLVLTERQHKRMRVDDVTLVSIAFDEMASDELSHS